MKSAQKKMNTSGFTLIELMVVVSIIGILAGIIVYEFKVYRVRSHNAAALSDVRNARTNESGLHTSSLSYGSTLGGVTIGAAVTGAVAPGTAGTIVEGPQSPGQTAVIAALVNGASFGIPTGLSNRVSLLAQTNAVVVNTITYGTAFNLIGKHRDGDTLYGVDSDVPGTYQTQSEARVSIQLQAGEFPAVNANTDDFQGKKPSDDWANNWTIM